LFVPQPAGRAWKVAALLALHEAEV
jgi:hypothetical protein